VTEPVGTPALHARRLARALALRCPHCGGPSGLRGLSLPPRCPRCGLRYDRGESDYFLGSYTLNLFAALLLAVAAAALGIRLARHGPPGVVIAIAGALIVVLAIALYPVTRLAWLAIDLAFRPPVSRDFEPPARAE